MLPALPPTLKAQLFRFLRLFGAALATQAVALDLTHLGRSAIVAAIVGAAEVAYRQWKPAAVNNVHAVIPSPPDAGAVNPLWVIAVCAVLIAYVVARPHLG